jgi:hypothetical protein
MWIAEAHVAAGSGAPFRVRPVIGFYPVGAENCVSASDQRVHGQHSHRHGPQAAQHDRRYGLRTRLPDARTRPELTGAARPLRHRQRRQIRHCATRLPCCAAPTLDRHAPGSTAPCSARVEQTAPSPAAPAAARLTPTAAAPAPPTPRPPPDRTRTESQADHRPQHRSGPLCCRWPARIPAGATDESRASLSDDRTPPPGAVPRVDPLEPVPDDVDVGDRAERQRHLRQPVGQRHADAARLQDPGADLGQPTGGTESSRSS